MAEISAAYARDEIGSRECLLDEWDLLAERRARGCATVVDEVALDPGARPLVEALDAAGAEVTIVSDGFGIRATEVAPSSASPVLSNRVDWAHGSTGVPARGPVLPCSTCGTCKQAPIKDARRRGRLTVLVGDGTSDRKAALLADVWCSRRARRCGGARSPTSPISASSACPTCNMRSGSNLSMCGSLSAPTSARS